MLQTLLWSDRYACLTTDITLKSALGDLNILHWPQLVPQEQMEAYIVLFGQLEGVFHSFENYYYPDVL